MEKIICLLTVYRSFQHDFVVTNYIVIEYWCYQKHNTKMKSKFTSMYLVRSESEIVCCRLFFSQILQRVPFVSVFKNSRIAWIYSRWLKKNQRCFILFFSGPCVRLLDMFYKNWRPVEQEERTLSFPTTASVYNACCTFWVESRGLLGRP